jgi:hypothetical protein
MQWDQPPRDAGGRKVCIDDRDAVAVAGTRQGVEQVGRQQRVQSEQHGFLLTPRHHAPVATHRCSPRGIVGNVTLGDLGCVGHQGWERRATRGAMQPRG